VKRRILFGILIGLGVLVLVTVAHYSVVVYNARNYTRDVIMPQIESEPMPLEVTDLSERQLQILLAVEDPAFYEHGGVDFRTPGAGITTITQGLVKQLYFERFKPGVAKLRQTLIAAFAFDPLVAKDDQLRLFINMCHLGNGTQGFEEAAQAYCGKPFASLTEDEYISLVAMIIAPRTFNLERYPERNAERVQRIKKLVAGEYVPKGLMDLFYGRLDEETQNGVPPFSYFERYYKVEEQAS